MKKLLLFSILFFFSCGGTLYELPPPKPKSEWRKVSLNPTKDAQSTAMLFNNAKAKLLTLYGNLNAQDFESATKLLSIETQDFLKFGSERSVSEVLSEKKIKLSNGKLVEFDPVSMLLAEDVSMLVDTVKGIPENETSKRKEIFAKQSDGSYQRIVMIMQGNTWVLHRTRISDRIQLPQ